jgi:feruloyl esterase
MPNLHFAFGTGLLKYFIFNDPTWNYAGYDFEDYREVSAETAALLNATDPDLSRLRDGGGKLILWHGWSDAALTALDSIDYYDSVEQRDPALRDYFRMYLMPGVGHCNGGPGPDRADWITAIEQWVENDLPPEQLIASNSDEQGRQIMERPICPYPQSASYDGSGDPDVSESYSCVTPNE